MRREGERDITSEQEAGNRRKDVSHDAKRAKRFIIEIDEKRLGPRIDSIRLSFEQKKEISRRERKKDGIKSSCSLSLSHGD